METIGSVADASGKQGINEKHVDDFFKETEAYLNWKVKGKIPEGESTTEIMPLGYETPQAYEIFTALKEKIEQYFVQCAMVKFDERALAHMQLQQKEFDEIDFTDKSKMEERLIKAPIVLPTPKSILDFNHKINPLYFDSLKEFKNKVLKPISGDSVSYLTPKQWERIKEVFTPYREWLESKQGAKVEKLGIDKLCRYTKGQYKRSIMRFISEDSAVSGGISQIQNLEKLILFQRWLLDLANSFVSFTNLYNPERLSLIEIGTLIIDGRRMTFTTKVEDIEVHKKIAHASSMYLLYLEIKSKEKKDIKFEAVAGVTSGSAGRLRIGKRGVFFTTDGKEWDAEVKDIVINPISIWGLVRAPFNQISSFIIKQIEKISKAKQTKIKESLTAPTTSGMTRDLLLGGSVAIAALGSSFAYMTKVFSQIKPIYILWVILGIIFVILLPGVIIGFLKIRKRNINGVMEASGWAINLNLRLNSSLGRLFTYTPTYPEGSRKGRKDLVPQFLKKNVYVCSRFGKVAILILITIIVIIIGILFIVIHPEIKLPLF